MKNKSLVIAGILLLLLLILGAYAMSARQAPDAFEDNGALDYTDDSLTGDSSE